MTDALWFAGAFLVGFLLCTLVAALLVRELIALHREERTLHVSEREQWRSERRELINRVQHPHLVPTATAPVIPPAQRAASQAMRNEWASVGRVVNGQGDTEELELP